MDVNRRKQKWAERKRRGREREAAEGGERSRDLERGDGVR